MKKKILLSIGILFLGNLFSPIQQTFAAGNVYSDAELEDINLTTYKFDGYPIKVNITSYYNPSTDSYVNGKPTANQIKNAKYVEFLFEDGKKIIVPVSRLYLSSTIGGDKSMDSDLIIDMPLYLKDQIDYGYIINADIKLLDSAANDSNNPFILTTGVPYVEDGETIWLIYNTNHITSDNQFLPRKVLVKLYDGSTLIKSQVIDVFKEGKLSVTIGKGQNITDIVKENFYVIGNTNEHNYWYANGPVIKKISCPDKISTEENCTINIIAFDSGTVKLYIKDKWTGDTYQIFSWDVQATGGTITKTFNVDPNLGYPDGEYIALGETYKNGIKQQEKTVEFVIDRFKPTFAEVFPVLLVPDNTTGSAVIDVLVSERLKADPIGLKCDFPVTTVQRDNENPYLYHLTIQLPASKKLTSIKCYLKDISLNENTGYVFLKRYKDNGNLGISNINGITNGLTMDISILPDSFIVTRINTLGGGANLIEICPNGNCSDKVSAISTYDNPAFEIDKELLIAGGANGTNVYKLYPDTKNYSSGYKDQIISISKDYLGNYWYVDKTGDFYKNTTLIGSKKDLIFYDLYKGSYIIEYYKNDGLYIDTQKISTNDFSSHYIGVDIIKPKTNDIVYMVGFDPNTGRVDYYYVDLLNKQVKKVLSVKVNKYNGTTYPDHVDFAYYNGKIIMLGGKESEGRSYMAILPLPEIILENDGKETNYVATSPLIFDKELYANLDLIAQVKGYMLPKVDDCGGNKTIDIAGQKYSFDDNEWCNLKELNLAKETNEDLIEPEMFYKQDLDNYTFTKKFKIYGQKYNIKKDLGNYDIELKNQPVEYWIGFVNESDILTTKNSPGWKYIKYNDKTFLSLPEIINYNIKNDLKNNGFYVYKKNLKLQSLRNKNGYYFPVVVYKTPYNTSEVRILGVSTIVDYITDPDTGKYIPVRRIVFKKPYKIDTIPPIFFDIKSDNTNPSVGDKITLSFKTTEPVDITKLIIGNVDISSYSINKTEKNNIYYYEIKDVLITSDMFDTQGQLWFTVGGLDKANNYNERKVNLAGLKGAISVSALKVGDIADAGEINVKDVLITNDQDAKYMKNLNVLTKKKIITSKQIGVKFPTKPDGTLDLKKLFDGAKMVDILRLYNDEPLKLNDYFVDYDSTNLCNFDYNVPNNELLINGFCGFIRNRVYSINSNLRINGTLKYRGYTTLFVNGDVFIDGNILRDDSKDKQNILGIVTTGNVYISPTVTNVQALIKTAKNIYVLK